MQNKRIHLKPAPGKKVRDDQTGHRIPEAGAWVYRNTYWLRRLAAGDVVEVKEQAAGGSKKAGANGKKSAQKSEG